ncbi:conserved protein of unknown function [Bartonella clarridgeiae 73]|uniref:Cell division protein FtsL n=1 Tax=Bartonella clarridgeiae (strain CCUG 45776 / CIP 104772 / 73) TaxID=696125 RepID=E6YIJ8_BARC7|nr:hypothetical protein [Bartonella clarridgeiae]WCR54747.1 MAG: Cell division protein FtsL [Bartonella clarridgeiae]CBI76686.1 conserved protein of unknown function [Bartonella clarridgeiae 73]
MIIFRTLDVILVVVMICMAGLTYKVKYDVQKQISEVHRIEREIAAEKNMVNLLHTEWAVMIEPSRMKKLAERYQKELNLEVIQPRQIVKLKDIPMRLQDQIEELIKQNSFEDDDKAFLAENRSVQSSVVQKGGR